MKKNRFIATLLSCTIAFGSFGYFNVSAKVIDPIIVKTEKWTTSYYIDDDIENLYPYIDCQADIYNDGSVKVSYWNTHEWDGFATVSHKVTIINSRPVKMNSREYSFKNENEYINGNTGTEFPVTKENYEKGEPFTKDYSFWNEQDLSYYPDEYNYNESHGSFYSGNYLQYYFISLNNERKNKNTNSLIFDSYYGALAKLAVNEKTTITFTPTVDPVGNYEFRVLGHDILVTPEVLSEKIVAKPLPSEQEKRISSLESTVKSLQSENEILKNKVNSYVFENPQYVGSEFDNVEYIEDFQMDDWEKMFDSAEMSEMEYYNIDFNSVIKADRWTTYYYIGDDKEKLYPLECVVLYTWGGEIYRYFWNTADWENDEWKKKFEEEFGLEWKNEYWNDYQLDDEEKYPFLNEKITIVNTPDEINFDGIKNFETYIYVGGTNYYFDTVNAEIGETLNFYLMEVKLCDLGINCLHNVGSISITTDSSFSSFGLIPTSINYLNHNLTLIDGIPVLISMDGYVNDKQKILNSLKFYKEYNKIKSENEQLKLNTDNDSILRCDTNGDGMIDGRDATTILTIYALNSTGKNITTFSEYQEYLNS